MGQGLLGEKQRGTVWIEVWVGTHKESLGVLKNGEAQGPRGREAGRSQQRPGGLVAQLRLWSSSEKLRAVTPDSAPRQEARRKKKLAGGCLPRGAEFSSPSQCPLALGTPLLGQTADTSGVGPVVQGTS